MNDPSGLVRYSEDSGLAGYTISIIVISIVAWLIIYVDPPAAGPLTVALAWLGPTWAIWHCSLVIHEQKLPGRIVALITFILGVMSFAIACFSFGFAAEFVFKVGWTMFNPAETLVQARTGRQARGLLFLALLPSLLAVTTAVAAAVSGMWIGKTLLSPPKRRRGNQPIMAAKPVATAVPPVQPQNPGAAAVTSVFDGLSVDREWSVRYSDGFVWWPHRQRQVVRTSAPLTADEITVARVLIMTDVVTSAPDNDRVTAAISRLNQRASFSAFVREDNGKVSVVCSLVVHKQNLDWSKSVLQLAAGLQLWEAEAAVRALQPLGAKPAWSAHPESGERGAPDEM